MKSLAYLDPKRFVDINRGILLIDGDNHLLKRLTNLANVNHEKLIIELKDFAASFESLYLTINADLKKEKLYEVKKLSENDEDQKNQDEEDDFNSSNSENECKYCLPCVFRLLHKYNFHSSAYTNLYLTYKLILTLACTQVNCERSFSKLKIIETRLRASLGQELLEALLLISIEKDKIPNSERIISEFRTGKTFLINLLLTKVRSNCSIALAVASSGIAATLLEGGWTAHSAFKLPLDLINIETPMCNIPKQSNIAEVLRNCKFIVWDENTMAHKRGFEALDRSLKDIRSNNEVMGGVTVLLTGDFSQILPVIPRGSRADEVKACIKASYLWPLIVQLSLNKIMWVHLRRGDITTGKFSELLLKIGDGDFSELAGKLVITKDLFVCGYLVVENAINFSKQKEYHKAVIRILFDVSRTLARQGLAFRGNGNEKNGNFYQIILLISRHNSTMKTWLNDSYFRRYYSTYLSHDSQDEFIHLLAKETKNNIIEEVKEAGMYSIIEDTMPDLLHKDQLSVCLRYVNSKAEVYEHLIAIDEIVDKTGKGIASKISDVLSQNSLNLNNIAFQSYDFASSMSSKNLVKPIFKILSIPIKSDIRTEDVEKACGLFPPSYETSLVTDYDAILCQINILRHKTEHENTLEMVFNLSESLKTLVPVANSLCRLSFTAPVTTASNERSFSKLKIIKNYLRTTMAANRLDDLMISNSVKDIVDNLNLEDLITNLAALKERPIKI
ncbi:hypothetical protein QTP88_027587 [Uroleucon formosanum]